MKHLKYLGYGLGMCAIVAAGFAVVAGGIWLIVTYPVFVLPPALLGVAYWAGFVLLEG